MHHANKEDETAELRKVCWLEITGHVEIHPLKRYQVGFKVSLTSHAYGWDQSPVYIMAKRGEKGHYARSEVNLAGRTVDEQFIIPENFVLENFVLDKDPSAFDRKLYFGLYEIWNGKWKGGLRVHQAFVKELDSSAIVQEPDSSPQPCLEPSHKLYQRLVYARDLTTDRSIWNIPPLGLENEPAELLEFTSVNITGSVEIDPLKSYQVGFQVSKASEAVDWDRWTVSVWAKRGNTGKQFLVELSLAGHKANEEFCIPQNFVLHKDPNAVDNKIYFNLYIYSPVKSKGGLLFHHAFVKEIDSVLQLYHEVKERTLKPHELIFPADQLRWYDYEIDGNDSWKWLVPTASQEDQPARFDRFCYSGKLPGNRVYINVQGSVEINPRNRYLFGFLVSLRSYAFGGDDIKVTISAWKGKDGQKFERVVSLAGLKANEVYIIPENLVLYEVPTASDNTLYFQMYGYFQAKDAYTGYLQIHQAIVTELISK